MLLDVLLELLLKVCVHRVHFLLMLLQKLVQLLFMHSPELLQIQAELFLGVPFDSTLLLSRGLDLHLQRLKSVFVNAVELLKRGRVQSLSVMKSSLESSKLVVLLDVGLDLFVERDDFGVLLQCSFVVLAGQFKDFGVVIRLKFLLATKGKTKPTCQSSWEVVHVSTCAYRHFLLPWPLVLES